MSDDRMLYKLPDAEEILRRLQSADVEVSNHMVAHFFPLFERDAGRELSPQGIAMVIGLHIEEFVDKGSHESMEVLMQKLPHWIDALVHDPVIASEAKQFHAMVMARNYHGS